MSNYDYTLYTDGSCQSNPGPGGWAYVLISGQKEERFCGGTRVTTNNRMELTAVIRGLTRVPEGSSVAVYSDAQYVTNAFNKGWIHNWKRLGWNNGSGTLKNTELWKILDGLVKARNVTFIWVKGHNGNKYKKRTEQVCEIGNEIHVIVHDDSPEWCMVLCELRKILIKVKDDGDTDYQCNGKEISTNEFPDDIPVEFFQKAQWIDSV